MSDLPIISGYAALWHSPTVDYAGADGRGYTITFVPGCFSRVLRKRDTFALLDHDRRRVIASQKDGSLYLEEDDAGLRFSIRPWDTDWGNIAVSAVRHGIYRGASLAWCHESREQDTLRDGVEIHEITEAGMWEVSLVKAAANPRTLLAVQG